MVEIALAAGFGFVWGLIALRYFSGRVISGAAQFDAFVYLVILVVIASINLEASIIPQKVASQAAYQNLTGGQPNPTFYVQTLVNAVPFLVTKAWWAAIGTNIAAMAVVKCYLFDRSRQLSLVMWAPAIVNFALFALRDPLIGLLMFFLTLAVCRHGAGTRGNVAEGTAAFLLTLSRPETIVIYAGTKLTQILAGLRRHPWLFAMIPLIIIGAFYGISMVPRLLGLPTDASLSELPALLQEFFVTRAERNDTTSGGGSNILGGRLVELPFLLRFPIQVICFFVLPLPFEIRGPELMLAFGDSIIFAVLFAKFWTVAPAEAKRLFVFYMLAVSFFVANYGNLFRLRMPAYFILAAGLLVAHLRTRAQAQEEDASGAPGAGQSR